MKHVIVMFTIAIAIAYLLSGCAAMLPQLTRTVEDIADDTAINCKVSKEAVQTHNLDMQINIMIKRQ